VPVLRIVGLVLRAVCSVAVGVIFLRLTSEEEHYRSAGICALVAGVASILVACFSGGAKAPTWTLAISIPSAIVGMVGEYHEFTAHSVVLTGLDNRLSQQWSSLWKWYIGTYCALIGSVLLIIISPILGLLVSIVAAIGLVIVSLLKLGYLYQTASAFRSYPAA